MSGQMECPEHGSLSDPMPSPGDPDVTVWHCTGGSVPHRWQYLERDTCTPEHCTEADKPMIQRSHTPRTCPAMHESSCARNRLRLVQLLRAALP